MKMIAAGVLACLLTTPAWAEKVGDWDVVQFPDQGPPTGCIMSGDYQDGTRFSVLVSTNYDWQIALANSTWNLKANDTTDVAVYVDGQFVESGKATHYSDKIAFLPLEHASTYDALRHGLRLDLKTPYGNLNFALTGTDNAMTEVLSCVNRLTSNGGQTDARQNPPQTDQNHDFQPVSLADETSMVKNLLENAKVTDYRINDTKSDDQAITFTLRDGTNGFFEASRGRDTALADDYASTVIGIYSKQCKANFVSAKKSEPTSDGSVVRRLLMTCRGDDTSYAVDSTIVRQADGFLMELSQSYDLPASGGQQNSPNDQQREALVQAAYHMPVANSN